MQSRNYLIEEFEKEVWLYLESSLDEDRMEFWNKNLKSNNELKNILDRNLSALNEVKYTPQMLSEAEYENMIKIAVKESGFQKISSFIKNSIFQNDNYFPKIAFGISLVIAAIMFSIISEKPNPIKSVPDDILAWNPTEFSDKIKNVENYFYSIKLEEQKEAEIQQTSGDQWNTNYYQLESELEVMRKEIEDNSL